MASNREKCIYCGNEFDPARGQGDHILPAALGEFQDDVRFRGQCPPCNNRIGRFEQQVLQSGPEGFYRAIVRPVSARLNKRGIGRQRGSLGVPGPVYTADMGDHAVLVEPSDENPRDMLAVDQLVIQDEHGQDHPLRLYPGMSASQLQDRIARLGIGKPQVIRLHNDEPHTAHYLDLLRELFPEFTIQEQSSTEAGNHQVHGRVAFTLNESYFQALAKIAFHYYLSGSRRGYRGDEPIFDDLRHFILNGGNFERIFSFSPGRFRLPFGKRASGAVVTPGQWCHLLAADESTGSVVVFLQLFVGPGSLRPPCYVTLGKLASDILVPDSVWGHIYMYGARSGQERYAGRVLTASISRLR